MEKEWHREPSEKREENTEPKDEHDAVLRSGSWFLLSVESVESVVQSGTAAVTNPNNHGGTRRARMEKEWHRA